MKHINKGRDCMRESFIAPRYLMENDKEALRLDLKTDRATIQKQARWAGIEPGMRVADVGCGPGKTTAYLHKLVQPDGKVVGLDYSEERYNYAQKHYHKEGIEFMCRDVCRPLPDLGMFDFIWVRFFLEYYCLESFDIVKNLSSILRPGGIICLIDLDYNCLSHFGLSERLERAIFGIMKTLENNTDFDPYAGRKLYSYLYDLGYQDINMDITPHHLIFGGLQDKDGFNWMMKIKIAAQRSGYGFEEYSGDYEKFLKECKSFFADPRRFTYTPVICCRGRKAIT